MFKVYKKDLFDCGELDWIIEWNGKVLSSSNSLIIALKNIF